MTENYPNDFKDLLTYSLREKPGSYLIEELCQRFPTTAELMNSTEEELVTIKGVGKGKARQITAMLKLAQALTAPVQEPYTIRSPLDVFNFLAPDFRYLQKEHFVCLFLNTKNHIIFKEIISIGSLNAAIIHPREVFRSAIKRACASLICSHNHPSGDPSPSKEDINVTKRLIDAGNIIGIEVMDHIIIGNHSFYSLKEKGHM